MTIPSWRAAVAACVCLLMALPWVLADDTGDAATPGRAEIRHGVVMLVPTQGNEVAGMLLLTQLPEKLLIEGEVLGLTPGLHGFHVYEYGDLRDPQGKAAGDHYNPDGNPHAGPEDDARHAGDLGNIEADTDGVAQVQLEAVGIGLTEILGRSIVVHAGEDDLESQPSGNSGPRIAVGVIGAAKPAE